jgi:hypothetical protein
MNCVLAALAMLLSLGVSTSLGQSPDWVHDALVVASPAAAVGGCQAGIYTPAVNGMRPWGNAIIRWLTGRHVMGNTSVLVRQDGAVGGAGLAAILDPQADYVFQVNVFLPSGREFGDRYEGELKLMATVLGPDGQTLFEKPVDTAAGEWKPFRMEFHNGMLREVRVVVRAVRPPRLPCVYFVDDFRLTRTDRWWSPQNVFDEARTAARLPDDRQRLCHDLDPDVVAGHNAPYLNWDGFFTRRGISVNGGCWEQEYNHLSCNDPAAERLVAVGAACALDGRPIQKGSLWPGYHMCHNAPAWHLYHQQRLARIAPEVDSIYQDNICAPSFEQAGAGCFCPACRAGFRHWLQQRWSSDALRAAGISDLAQFDIAQYVGSTGAARIKQGRDAVLADPVLRAYIQYQYASQLDRWRDTVAAVKRAAGHPLAMGGNQWGANGMRAYAVALSQVGDVVAVETSGRPHTPYTRTWDTLSAKLPAAAGAHQRPVWLYLTSLFHVAEAPHSRLRFTAAQAWADGAVPTPWATAPGSGGWFFDGEARVCRFVQAHRALFARRERYANVALVYSLPTQAWRKFKAFKLTPEPMLSWFAAWARLLEEAHLPYEIHCWSHPLLGSDRATLARLARQQVLILPGVDCFTDAQRDAVRTFQARGGRVLNVPCPRYFDGDAAPRLAGETLTAPGKSLIDIDPQTMTCYAQANAKPTAENARTTQAAAAQLTGLLRQALGSDALLSTTAPPSVWSNLWLDDTRQVLALHLVNGDIDLAADRLRTVAQSQWRVRLPAGLKVDRAVMLTPDAADERAAPRPLPVELSDGWATVRVPRVESYTIVALYADQSLAAADHLANARRALWRARLIDGRPRTALAAEVQRTLALLRAKQVDAGAKAAAALAEKAALEFERARPTSVY